MQMLKQYIPNEENINPITCDSPTWDISVHWETGVYTNKLKIFWSPQ